MLTKDQVVAALPAHLKTAATQELTDLVNNIANDPVVAEQVRNNFIGYTSVLREGRFKTEDYVHAVTYVSYKLMGYSNQDAYFKTFPKRHQDLLSKGTSTKDISSYVAAYAKGKMVNLIMEQSLVPSWVLNQDLYQKALNVQADLMANSASDKVRCDAANSILTHLSKPKENTNLQLNIGSQDSSGMTELKDALTKLAQQQQQLIQHGATTKEIAAATIVDAEVKEVR
jgi:hypothetical protein